MKKAILFDLDGTLLPMDMEKFTKGYFSLLAKKAAPAGYAPEKLVKTIWQGTGAMVKNDGTMANAQRFWQVFGEIYGEEAKKDQAIFDSFYENEFRDAIAFANPNPALAQAAVGAARDCAEIVILATNPIFPETGVAMRLSWLGLSLSDFDYVTTYENSGYCKPNPKYYEAILNRFNLAPEDALMIGNDIREDILSAGGVGIDCCLVTDCRLGDEAVSCPEATLELLPEKLRQLCC